MPALTQTVTVGNTTFACPAWWQVAPDQPDEDAVRIEVFDEAGGELVGHVVITAGSPAEASRSSMICPDALFGGLAASESSSDERGAKSVWGLERIDLGDIPMARALCAAAQTDDASASDAVVLGGGWLYMALAPDWTFVYLEALVEPARFTELAPLVEAVWASAVWPPAVTPETAEAANDDYEARALRRGQRRNREHPYYNAHWDVVGFECTRGSSYGEDVSRPSFARYVFATPEGFEGTEWKGLGSTAARVDGGDGARYGDNAIMRREVDLFGYDLPTLWLWCIERTDSNGTPYLRSTVEVEGRGVVDIAWYKEINTPLWYVADTGEPVCPREGSTSAEESWVLMSDQTGVDYEPWRDVAGN